MLNSITIENYKSIQKQTFDLKRVNVFIGKNGCGKSNILEAIAMASDGLYRNIIENNDMSSRGIRITKPIMTMNSFESSDAINTIQIAISFDGHSYTLEIVPVDAQSIFSSWKSIIVGLPNINNVEIDHFKKSIQEKLTKNVTLELHENPQFIQLMQRSKGQPDLLLIESLIRELTNKQVNEISGFEIPKTLHDFAIYTINTATLRGISGTLSMRQPLGIYGEGLDLLLQVMSPEEKEDLYANMDLIDWLDQFEIHADSEYLGEGHKLGRSSSSLYFKDKYMQKKNNIFSAENANEGALHVLFYLALIISKRTPSIFAIDNIESSLNPKLCTEVMKRIMILAEKHNKQILITTHNPAILDGINLASDQQALFVVDRNDHGMTIADPIKTKKELKNKLSELWMRGALGGVPTNF